MTKNTLNNLITKNKKAYFDYEIKDVWESGIELKGYEVKSVRSGDVNLKGSYIVFHGAEAYIKGMHITPWKTLSNKQAIDASRERKIFLNKKTIIKLLAKSKEGGISIIPLELYFRGSLIKLKVGLAKGKKAFEKKQILKERTMDNEAKKIMSKYV